VRHSKKGRSFRTVTFTEYRTISGDMAAARLLVCLLALCLCFVSTIGSGATVTSQTTEPVLFPDTNSSELSGFANTFLPIVECEYGDKDERGLACEKEGYFISGFQHEAFCKEALFPQDKIPVPAAKAICCRLKLPRQVPQDGAAQLPKGTVPKAIISVGCHKSSTTGGRSMQCESTTSGSNSFVAGFLDSRITPNPPQYFYPVDGPVCCTPVLKLSSGDAWELKRCDCVTSDNIQCGRRATDRLLWGFLNVGRAQSEIIPLTPALCCKVCLGSQLYDMSECGDLKHCSDHGVCIMGSCSCQTGWAGPDCSQEIGSGSNSDAWWQSFWWLGVIGFMCAFTGLFATFWMIQRAEWADRNPNQTEGEESLLQWVEVEGSAGSEDTSVSETSSNASHPSATVSVEIASVEDAGDESSRPDEDAREHRGIGRPRIEGAIENRVEGATETQEDRAEAEQDQARTSHEIEDDDSHNVDNGEVQKMGDDESDGQLLVKQLQFNGEANPLAGLLCSVCMTHPIQVALVPCGHSNLCRRCSRKLQRCPFCRKEIFRRQKLFLSG